MIRIFGDSFSCWDYPTDKSKHFYSLLSNKMKMSYTNYAKKGTSNQQILHSIINNINEIQDDDIIIVNLTEILRMQITPGGEEVIYAQSEQDERFSKEHWKIIEKFHKHIFMIREDDSCGYITEIENLLKHISKRCKVIVWFWGNCDLDKFKLSSEDNHLNEEGHMMLYNRFYNHLSTSQRYYFDKFDKKTERII